MHRFVFILLLAAIPHWVANAVVMAQEPEGEANAHFLFVTKSGDADCGIKVPKCESGQFVQAVVLASEEELEPGDGRSERRVITRTVRIAGPPRGEGGFLGVSVGKVPSSTAALLDIGTDGLILLNVVADSPADKAGLQENDIILTVDGETLDGSVGRLVKLISSRKPGEVVELGVLKDGEETAVNVELGARGDVGQFQWKFLQRLPFGEVEDRIITRGKLLRRGDDGEWTFEDLGDLRELAELPHHMRMFLPKTGSRTSTITLDDGEKTVEVLVKRVGGQVLAVEQAGDGEITVRRTDEDGNETVEVYADDDALREGDLEAFDALEGAGKTAIIHLEVDGLPDLGDLDFNLEFDVSDWSEHLKNLQVHLEERMGEAGAGFESAMERLEGVMERLHEEGGPLDSDSLRALPMLLHGKVGDGRSGRFASVFHFGKPRHTFEQLDDGTIEVRIRKGDSELLQVFSGEADLEHQRPDLFEKYRDLIEADEK